MGRLALAAVAAVASFLVVLVASAWVALPFELTPDGPACDFAVDPGSGPSGQGEERIEWSISPERVCGDSTGIVHRGVDEVFGLAQGIAYELLTFGAGAVVVAVLGAAFGAGWLVNDASHDDGSVP